MSPITETPTVHTFCLASQIIFFCQQFPPITLSIETFIYLFTMSATNKTSSKSTDTHPVPLHAAPLALMFPLNEGMIYSQEHLHSLSLLLSALPVHHNCDVDIVSLREILHLALKESSDPDDEIEISLIWPTLPRSLPGFRRTNQ